MAQAPFRPAPESGASEGGEDSVTGKGTGPGHWSPEAQRLAALLEATGEGDERAFAELFRGHERLRRHLVLPANADIEDARASYQTFRCLEPATLLPTKLDETVRRARPLEIAVASGLPLSAFGCGQRVPEDFGYFSYAWIRRKLLGLDNASEGS